MNEAFVEYEEEEYVEYYEEEEVMSRLSTILEAENESDSGSTEVKGQGMTRPQVASVDIPENISVNPMADYCLKMLSLDSSWRSLPQSPKPKELPIQRHTLSLPHQPEAGAGIESSTNGNSCTVCEIPPTTIFSDIEEEVLLEDDDEYTYISFSGSESNFGLDEISLAELSVNSSGCISIASSAGSIKSLSSAARRALDFESARNRLQQALERRTEIKGKGGIERLDCFRRKLGYDISRRMLMSKF